jgi:hypothetical protein
MQVFFRVTQIEVTLFALSAFIRVHRRPLNVFCVFRPTHCNSSDGGSSDLVVLGAGFV